MNVIIAYLETMFSAYPQTPRLLEAKAELQAMMEDAYAGLIAEGVSQNEAVGKIITDFGNLDELAPTLGISAEIAPASAAPVQPPSPAAPARKRSRPLPPPVTMEEAESFADAQRRTRYRLATASVLFVVSPIPLLLLGAAGHLSYLDTVTAGMIGVVLLLFIVAAGVLLIGMISRDFAPVARLQTGHFTPDPVVTRWADELARTHERGRGLALTIAVVMWILSAVPLFLIVPLTQESPDRVLWITVGIAITLLVVAAGLFVLIPSAWAHTVADTMKRAGLRPHDADEA